jgi:hypothetical protein
LQEISPEVKDKKVPPPRTMGALSGREGRRQQPTQSGRLAERQGAVKNFFAKEESNWYDRRRKEETLPKYGVELIYL